MKPLISNTVSKLGENIPCFNLPALTTCPGKTELCSKYCYAKHGNYGFSNVKNKLQYNFKMSKKRNFMDTVKAEIHLMAIKGIKYFRLHSSGDFYSQRYLNVWKEIAVCFPKIKFLAYTRSYMLDFSNLPKNFSVFYSTDKSTKKYNGKLNKIATVYYKKDFPVIDRKKEHVCKSKCKDCKLCWNTKKNIVFRMHN